ncbi:AAA family ATPase [Bacillus wiedmannii]|uniref:AAA family ATPase n=1 Tax=Bacillus wiedmannii TaxID=1890302 RepID=UPI000BF94FF1|nr:AAA family ATPase [Bacillus wiedmannii]PEP14032.1 hypothetical protein CN552_16250 [Bacillus wiedmannii]
MELLYIWLEDFNDGLIREQGFNFDNRFQYQLRCKENDKFELNIKPNPNYLEGFFEPEFQPSKPTANIKNITAIVGQNGSGKSSIIDFLKENFGREDGGQLYKDEIYDKKYLYIFRKYKSDKFEHYIYVSPKINIDIIKNENLEFYYEKRIDGIGLPRNLGNTNLIYFSNVYDSKVENSSEKMLNISTNYLSSNQYLQDKSYEDSLAHEYKLEEIKRQMEFVYSTQNSLKQFKMPFKLPEKINFDFIIRNRAIFNIMEQDESIFMDSIKMVYESTKPMGMSPNLLRKIKKEETFKIAEIEIEKKVIINFTRLIIVHIASEYLRDADFNEFFKNTKLFTTRFTSDFRDGFIKLTKELREFSSVVRTKGERFKESAKMLEAVAMLMKNFYEDYRHHAEVFGANFVRVPFRTEELAGERFKVFFDLYKQTYNKDEFVNVSWRELSSGENAFLNIYSRFYFVSQKKELLDHPENDLIILIDEGEVYLHPHWQSNLVNSLIEFLPIIFKNNEGLNQRNIQMILTSNSPFLVSDLPSANTIFLKKEQAQTIIIEGLDEYHQTFAANIHSLLAHSFFMEDGVTGKFAKRKINEIIHLLVKEDIDTILENEEKIEKTINLIGEPVIRNKLSQMLIDRRMVGVNKEITKLNSRLKRLEKWKDDKN